VLSPERQSAPNVKQLNTKNGGLGHTALTHHYGPEHFKVQPFDTTGLETVKSTRVASYAAV